MSWHRIGRGGTKYWGLKGAGVLFTDGQSVLLLQRADPTDRPKCWSIPGGKAKIGESAINTALRETKEETGREDVPGTRFAEHDSRDGQHHFITFLYRVPQQFPVTLSHEHTAWSWVPFKDLNHKDLSLHPRFQESLPQLLHLIRKRGVANFQEWLIVRQAVLPA